MQRRDDHLTPLVDRPPSLLLRTLFRLPVHVFEWGLGGAFGGRLLLLRHRGRHTGRRYATPLEVVAQQDDPSIWYVAAAWGERADWLQNLRSSPGATVVVGRRERAVVANVLDVDEAAEIYDRYVRTRRVTARVIGRLIGVDIRHAPPRTLAARMPIVALRALHHEAGVRGAGRPGTGVGEHEPERTPAVAPVISTRAQTRATYDRIAPVYQMLEGLWERRAIQRGLAALDARPGESILDIGCGPGVALVHLAGAIQPHGRVAGLDLSPRMCRIALRRVERAGLRATASVLEGDAADLPIHDGCIDACFMSFTLELFDTPEIADVLREARRVLRAGGRIGVVALSRTGPDRPGRRLYEWGHRKLPRLVDCRPIYPARSLADVGFDVTTRQLASLWGLPVEVVVAVNPRTASRLHAARED